MISRFPKLRTAALMTGLGLLMRQELLAQGVSPWLDAITVLEGAFTGPIARGLSLIAIVVGGLMFAFGEGGSKRALGRDHLWIRHGDGRGQFPDLVVLMHGAKTWPAYLALSAPLTIMGVERRWFLLSAMLGLAMWNAINSLVTGGMIFLALYGAGWFAWREDPNMVEILRASTRYKARYDPGKLGRDTLVFANPRALNERPTKTKSLLGKWKTKRFPLSHRHHQ